jgi:hypothetical protein
VSASIAVNSTVVGCIRRLSRHDPCTTPARGQIHLSARRQAIERQGVSVVPDCTWREIPIRTGESPGDGFGQASLRSDWQFATVRRS